MATRWFLATALIASSCADDGALVGGGDTGRMAFGPDAIELIGVSGRRLGDGDVYRVPLDQATAVTSPGAMRREAFVIRNMSIATATILDLSIAGVDISGDEWTVLAPTRARERPLDAGGVRLPPGTRLDFDVGFRPRTDGERVAELELLIAFDDHTEVRVVTLRARCARGPP